MPSAIDSAFAAWLRAPALFSSTTNGTLPAGLDPSARESEVMSPMALKASADAEGVRQMAILGAPLALDRHIVKGQRRDLIGKAVTLKNASLGYGAGEICYVVEAEEQDDNVTILGVIRKLG